MSTGTNVYESCFHPQIEQVMQRGLIEKLLSLMGVHMYRCSVCNRRLPRCTRKPNIILSSLLIFSMLLGVSGVAFILHQILT